jgi:hypothetical protein
MRAAVVFCLAAVLSPAAELSIERVTAQPGKKITAMVNFKAEGAAVTTLQFDVEYNESVMIVSGALGNAGEAASKQITVMDGAPNRKRVLLWGLNHNNLEDGAVVALMVEIKPKAAEGEYPLQLKAAKASNARGSAMPVRAVVDGKVTVSRSAGGQQ